MHNHGSAALFGVQFDLSKNGIGVVGSTRPERRVAGPPAQGFAGSDALTAVLGVGAV